MRPALRPPVPARRRRRSVPFLVLAAILLASCQGGGPPEAERGKRVGIVPAVVRDPPSAEVVALAAAMSEEGKDVFFATRPKVLDKAEFEKVCPDPEDGQVLGCYGDNRIFILRVSRPELAGVMEVTAAHEMLHAVYDDLSPGARRRLDGLVDAFYGGVTDTSLRELVAEYERFEPGQRLNELHSLLPTQLSTLDPPLEEHYRRYFTARTTVAAAYQRYSGFLRGLERRIEALDAEITAMKTQLDALDGRIAAEGAALDQLNSRLDGLKARGSVQAYNQLVAEQNAKARAVRALVTEYNRLVDVHNGKITEINALALEQDQLVDGLEGKVPVPP